MTDRFDATARAMATASGLPDYPFVTIPHPIAANTDQALRDKAEAVIEPLVRLVTRRPPDTGGGPDGPPPSATRSPVTG